MDLTDLWLAYIGGLFDGEGSITLYKNTLGKRKYIKVCISNNNLLILQILKGLINMGRINNSQKCKGLIISKQNNAEKFLKAIQPFCFIKHKKIKEALDFIEKHPLLKPQERLTKGSWKKERLKKSTIYL